MPSLNIFLCILSFSINIFRKGSFFLKNLNVDDSFRLATFAIELIHFGQDC